MDYQSLAFGIGGLIVLAVLARAIRVAGEHERFAVIALGQLKGFKGPGLLLKLDLNTQWLRVKVGDRGELLAPGVVRLGGRELPVADRGGLSPLQLVRVTGFEGKGPDARLVVELDADQRRQIECPQCGHVIELG